MTDPMVTAVEPDTVSGMQPLHGAGKIWVRRLHEQMIVIGHQDVGMDQPAVDVRAFLQPAQETLAIMVIAKNCLPLIAPGGDVIPGMLLQYAQWSRHAQDPARPESTLSNTNAECRALTRILGLGLTTTALNSSGEAPLNSHSYS